MRLHNAGCHSQTAVDHLVPAHVFIIATTRKHVQRHGVRSSLICLNSSCSRYRTFRRPAIWASPRRFDFWRLRQAVRWSRRPTCDVEARKAMGRERTGCRSRRLKRPSGRGMPCNSAPRRHRRAGGFPRETDVQRNTVTLRGCVAAWRGPVRASGGFPSQRVGCRRGQGGGIASGGRAGCLRTIRSTRVG